MTRPFTIMFFAAVLWAGSAAAARPSAKRTVRARAQRVAQVQPAVPGAPASAPDQVDISVKQRSSLTPQDMVVQSQDYLKRMADVLQRVSALQETAKKQKDIIKLNCVTDKLVQTKANLNVAESAMTSLQESIARNDEGARTHDFTRLTIVNQKVTVLGTEAENCIGEDLSFVGSTKIDTEVDPTIPTGDPTQPPPPGSEVERPPEASPYK